MNTDRDFNITHHKTVEKSEQMQLIEKKVDFSTLPCSSEYPFILDGIGERVYVTKEREDIVVDKNNGDLYVMKALPKTQQVAHDSKTYTKFFREAANKMNNLSVPATNMLFLIISQLEINSNFICISEDDFIEHFGYSPKSKRLYYRAIVELCQLEIIRRRANFSRCYWVNANVIFNGDRTKIK